MLLALVALFLAGFAVRLIGIAEPPLSFHPTRQYEGLIRARHLYHESGGSLSPEVAAAIEQVDIWYLEPPILDAAVAAGYHLVGGERIWVGPLLSTLAWLGGGWCLFAIARRLVSAGASIAAVAAYLLLPYGVPASRSYQPDPLMVALALAAVLAGLRYEERPTYRRAVGAGVVGGLAVLVKPVAVFVVAPAFMVVLVRRHGLFRAFRNPATWVLGGFLAVPAVAYYLVGIAGGGSLRSQAEGSFVPTLLTTERFWSNWWDIIDLAVGSATFLIALVASLFAARSRSRHLLAALWAGYLFYGLAFTYHIHTHDYYHLPLIPLVALGIAVALDAALDVARRHTTSRMARPVLAASAGVVLAALLVSDIRHARSMSPPSGRAVVAMNEAIGRMVGHSRNVISLTLDYGESLRFHGLVDSSPWPSTADVGFWKLQAAGTDALEREFERTVVSRAARWFVVTDLEQLKKQPDLSALLDRRGRVTARGRNFRIYELQR